MKYTLPKEFAEKWLVALRSGEYKQGEARYYTKSTDSYCAMGVGYKANDIEINKYGSGLEVESKRVFQSVGDNAIWFELSRLNDVQHKSFPEISDWIEQNVEFI